MNKRVNPAITIAVDCCAKCPFYEYQDEGMDSSCGGDGNLYFGHWSEVDRWVDKEVHKDCPLKIGSIVVYLKNTEKQ